MDISVVSTFSTSGIGQVGRYYGRNSLNQNSQISLCRALEDWRVKNLSKQPCMYQLHHLAFKMHVNIGSSFRIRANQMYYISHTNCIISTRPHSLDKLKSALVLTFYRDNHKLTNSCIILISPLSSSCDALNCISPDSPTLQLSSPFTYTSRAWIP